MDSSWSSYNDMRALLEAADIFFNYSASDASVYFYTNIFTEWVNYVSNLDWKLTRWGYNKSLAVVRNTIFGGSVDQLEDRDSKGNFFTKTWLCLHSKSNIQF